MRRKLANRFRALPSFEDALAMAHKQRDKSLAVDWGSTEHLLADDQQYASDDEDDYDHA